MNLLVNGNTSIDTYKVQIDFYLVIVHYTNKSIICVSK